MVLRVALGTDFAKQAMVDGFAKATANEDNAFQNAATAAAYREQNSKELDERLAEIGREGAVAAADDATYAYFFAGDGEAGSKAREIHRVRKSDGKTVSVTPVDTEALTANFVVDARRGRYYVNDGVTIFAQEIKPSD